MEKNKNCKLSRIKCGENNCVDCQYHIPQTKAGVMEHTKLPWKKEPHKYPNRLISTQVHGTKEDNCGFAIADFHGPDAEDNLAFVIAVCNAHDDLLAACKKVSDWWKHAQYITCSSGEDEDNVFDSDDDVVFNAVISAIKKARM